MTPLAHHTKGSRPPPQLMPRPWDTILRTGSGHTFPMPSFPVSSPRPAAPASHPHLSRTHPGSINGRWMQTAEISSWVVAGSRWGKRGASHSPEPSLLWDRRPPPEVPALVRKGAGPGRRGSAVRPGESSQRQRGRPEKAGHSSSLPGPVPGAARPLSAQVQPGGCATVALGSPPSPGRWASARWKPPPALGPLSVGASRGEGLLQVGPSGPCSSFSALAEPSSPSTVPHTVPSSFLEGSGGFPFFSRTKERRPT